MIILPIHTRVLTAGDDLALILADTVRLQPQDIVAISSKAVATCEDAFYQLSSIHPSAEAHEWAAKSGRSAEFCHAVLQETARLHGRVLGHCPGALVTEVRPEGLTRGTIITANAGLDESNTPHGTAIGWPQDPVRSVRELRSALSLLPPSPQGRGGSKASRDLGILLTDSKVMPRRIGVSAFTLACAGLHPFMSEIGTADLFGRPMTITVEAVADNLATAANYVMGNAAQSCPAAVIRDHGVPLTDFCGWVPGIEPETDLFRGIL